MKKILIHFTAFILLLTIALGSIGCNETNEETDTGKYIIKNNASEYSIVIKDKANSDEILASQELQDFIKQATKVELPVKPDSELSENDGAKYISLGRNSLSDKAELKVDTLDLGSQGYLIKTIGDNIFVCGEQDLGTIYGVYELLYRLVDFDVLGPDKEDIHIEYKNDIKLQNFNIVDKPDLDYRITGYGMYGPYGFGMTENGRRLRFSEMPFFTINGSWNHSTTEYFSKEEKDAHPDCFSNSFDQLCYTAHGNESEFQYMKDKIVSEMKNMIDRSPEQTYLPLMQMDNISGWCNCDHCRKYVRENGNVESVLQFRLANEISSEITEWAKVNHPGKTYKVTVFAYNMTLVPPTKVVENKHCPYNENAHLHENVAVFVAPITSNFYYPLNDAKHNSGVSNIFDGWGSITKNVMLWNYSTNFLDFSAFFDTFGSAIPNYKYIHELGGELIFDECQGTTKDSTVFSRLKAYILSKASWDTSLKYEDIVGRYFDLYFQEASESMRIFFDSLRLKYAELINSETGESFGDCLTDNTTAKNFDYGEILGWNKMIKNAFSSIASIKQSEPERYDILSDRIERENIAIRYLKLQVFPNTFSSNDERMAEIEDFRNDVIRLKITDSSLMQKIERWGKN